jgi:hypothetical protein
MRIIASGGWDLRVMLFVAITALMAPLTPAQSSPGPIFSTQTPQASVPGSVVGAAEPRASSFLGIGLMVLARKRFALRELRPAAPTFGSSSMQGDQSCV